MKKKIDTNKISCIILILICIALIVLSFRYMMLANKLGEEARYYKNINERLITEGGDK